MTIPLTKNRRQSRSGSGWIVSAAIVAILVLLPVFALVLQAVQGSSGLWSHLLVSTLPAALVDTIILLCGVGLLVAFIGTGTAWLVTAYEFPGRRILEWALILPLAVPTYIIAYAYLDILHPIGAVQGAIRWIFGFSSPREFRLPDLRNMTGCIILLGFVLYPYVYIPTRALFLMQSSNLIEAARTLGVARRQIFWRVALPLARPAIAVGVSLALMEALNDIGASEFLGIRTLTVSIYTTWVTRTDLPGASQIALSLLLIVVALVAIERWARRKQRYSVSAQRSRAFEPSKEPALRGSMIFCVGLVPVLIGFVFPAIYLATEAWRRFQFAGVSSRFLAEAINTVVFATIATVVTVALGVLIAYVARLRPGAASNWFFRLSTIGYAAPGTVIAIGVLILLAGLDQFINRNAMAWFGYSTGLLFIGSGAALIYAYTTRFLAISAGSMEAGLTRIPLSFDHASRSLGLSPGGTFKYVHLPLSKTALTAAALLVFVDCVKELPATLLLRPLNFETFATQLYGEAARGTYEEASIAALAIVAIGILPVILLSRVGRRKS